MTAFTGANMELTFDSVDFTGLREVDIPEEQATHESGGANEDNTEYIPEGITDRSGCRMVFVDDDDHAAWDACSPGTSATMVFYPEGNSAGNPQYTGTAVIRRRQRPIQRRNLTIATVEFDISGAWTESDVAA